MTSTHTAATSIDPAIQRLLSSELSRPKRFAYVALLLFATGVTSVVTALLLTEPALAARTQAAFSVMVAIGVSWIALFAWTLTSRRPLLGRDSLIAGYMSVAFTTMFALGSLAVGYGTSQRAPYAAAAMGFVLLAVAIALLARARRRVAQLVERRLVLERELGKASR